MSGTESELGHLSSSGIEVDSGMEPGAAGCTFPACLPAALVVAHPHSLQVGFPPGLYYLMEMLNNGK